MVRIKKAANRRRIKRVTLEETPELEARRTLIRERKKFSTERGFLLTDEAQVYKPWVYAIIELQSWGIFAEHPLPEDVNLSLAQEFVTNFPTNEDEPNIVVVRGVAITIDAEMIREAYCLDEVVDEFEKLKKRKKDKKFRNEVAKVICGNKKKKWELGKELSRLDLCPEAQVWITFIRGKLIPTLHDTTISLERGILLYCLLTGRYIDVGPIIYRRLCEDAKQIKHSFFFTDLVKKLCEIGGVNVEDDEATVPLLLPITAKTVNKIMKSNDAETYAEMGLTPPPKPAVRIPPVRQPAAAAAAPSDWSPPPHSEPSSSRPPPSGSDMASIMQKMEKMEADIKQLQAKDRERKIYLRQLRKDIRKHRIRNLDLCTQLKEKWRMDQERYEMGEEMGLPTEVYPEFPNKVMTEDFDEVYGAEELPEEEPQEEEVSEEL